MSTAQTIKNVCVTKESVFAVADELAMKVNENENDINIEVAEGEYGNVRFTKNEDGNYDIVYDSDYSERSQKFIDCTIGEEAISQVVKAKSGQVETNMATAYKEYLAGQAEELRASISY